MTQFLKKKDKPSVEEAEIKLMSFIVEHNLPFRSTDHLTDLLTQVFPDSKIAQEISLKRTKATATASSVINASEKKSLAFQLWQTKFSIIWGESTDIITQKSSCVVVRFNDAQKQEILSKFWSPTYVFDPSNPDLADEDATGNNLYKSLIARFEKIKVAFTNLIGFAADRCAAKL